ELADASPGQGTIDVGFGPLGPQADDLLEVRGSLLIVVLPEVRRPALGVQLGKLRPQGETGAETGRRLPLLGEVLVAKAQIEPEPKIARVLARGLLEQFQGLAIPPRKRPFLGEQAQVSGTAHAGRLRAGLEMLGFCRLPELPG